MNAHYRDHKTGGRSMEIKNRTSKTDAEGASEIVSPRPVRRPARRVGGHVLGGPDASPEKKPEKSGAFGRVAAENAADTAKEQKRRDETSARDAESEPADLKKKERERTSIPKILKDIAKKNFGAAAYFVFTAVLSSTAFSYKTYPFGLSLLCAASTARYTAAAFLGLAAGSVFADGGAYVTLVAVVIVLARTAIGTLRKKRVPGSSRLNEGGKASSDPVFSVGTSADQKETSRDTSSGSVVKAASFVRGAGSASERADKRSLLFTEEVPVRCALSAAGAMVIGGIGILFHGSVWRGIAAMTLSAVVAPVLCASFSGFFNRRSRSAFFACLLASAFSVSWMLSGITAGSFGIGPTFALLFSFIAAHFFALPEAILASFAVSLPLEFAVIPAVLLAAGIYSLVRRQFPTLAAAAGAMTAFFFSLGTLGMTAASRYGAEFLIASALCVPICRAISKLPEHITAEKVRLLRTVLPVSPSFADKHSDPETNRAADELLSLSECFTALGEMAKGVTRALSSPSGPELRERVERSFERRCTDCPRQKECGADGAVGAYRRDIAAAMRKGKGVSSVPVPSSLSARCADLSPILRSISPREKNAAASSVHESEFSQLGVLLKNASERIASEGEYDAGSSRRLRSELISAGVFADEVSVVSPRLRMTRIRGVEPSSFHMGTSDLRERVSRLLGTSMTEPKIALNDGALDITLHAGERYRVVMGKCSVSANASPCGDSASAFVSRDGFFYALISDGMGSGSEAAFTSETVTLFFERLLSAGVGMDDALRMTNSFLRERRIECSATVDVAQIDLVRGGACFYKSGAAPSFVLRSGNLFALRSRTVPIGILPGADAEGISFDVDVGDVIVMASDGVTGNADECPWLYEVLCEQSTTNLTEAAKQIAGEAKARCEDDVTVMLLRVEEA